MMKHIIFSAMLIFPLIAGAQTLDGKSDDYKAGWHAGYDLAVEQSMRNRDHFRALVGKSEPYQEAINRIYSNKRLPESSVVDGTLNTTLDGIDLYVVLPPKNFKGPTP